MSAPRQAPEAGPAQRQAPEAGPAQRHSTAGLQVALEARVGIQLETVLPPSNSLDRLPLGHPEAVPDLLELLQRRSDQHRDPLPTE